jgi:branched-subunit amino acid ABC-type transport system permease component
VVVGVTQQFWLALLIAPLGVGLLGALLERTVIRRLRGRPPIDTLLLTFGLALLLEEAIRMIWGTTSLSIPAPEALTGAVELPLIGFYPKYRLFVILAGAVIGLALVAFLQFTRFGLVIRGVASDAEMVGALGVNVPLVMTFVFALGSALAAAAGVIVGPLISAYPSMGIDIIIDAFVVSIVGGLGSFSGAIVAALLIGQAVTLGNTFIPEAAMVIIFAVMGAVLLWRPRGILGQGRV